MTRLKTSIDATSTTWRDHTPSRAGPMATASVAFLASPFVHGTRALGTSRRGRVSRRSPPSTTTRCGLGASDGSPTAPHVGGHRDPSSRSRPSRAPRPDAIARAAPTPAAPPPDVSSMRIAVVGAGPCGLTTALALRHHGFTDVAVYDKYPTVRPALGAAFNLNGGAAVLEKLGLLSAFRRLNNPMHVVRTRRATPDRTQLMRVDVPDLIRSDPAARASLVAADGAPLCGTVMRADLLRALADALPEDALRLGREVTGARTLDGPDGGVALAFADGSTSDRFDLVVGADGIRSAVRASAFGDAPAKYSGIRIVFGCTAEGDESASASARDPAEHGEVHQWFGDGCYTLVYTAGGGETETSSLESAKRRQHNVAVCISDDAATDENAEWTRAGGKNAAQTDADAKAACLRAIDAYGMPEDVRRVAERCDRFFDVGVHYHDPLPRWRDERGAVVLAGDSCHAMPPFLGQGANQSLQDAWCLAERLGKVGSAYADVKDALDAYEAARKPPTEQIMLSSRVIGFVETGRGPVAMARDVAFFGLGAAGVAGKIFLKNAVPVLE